MFIELKLQEETQLNVILPHIPFTQDRHITLVKPAAFILNVL